MVLSKQILNDNGRLLQTVHEQPALRALFMRLAGLYPMAALQAGVDGTAPMALTGVTTSAAVDIFQRAGQAQGLAFLSDMVARGFLFNAANHARVEPMKTRDVAYVTRELLGVADPSAVLCIQLMLAAQKHESYWTKIEAYLRGHSSTYWPRARALAGHDVYLRFRDGSVWQSSSPDADAPLTLVTVAQLNHYMTEAVPVAWVNEQGIDIVVFTAGSSKRQIQVHCAQLKCGSLHIEFGGGDMKKHDVDGKAVRHADELFAPVLVNFKRGLQKLLPQLEAAFPGHSFVPSTFRLFTSKGWSDNAKRVLKEIADNGGLEVPLSDELTYKVVVEETTFGVEWIVAAVPPADRGVCNAILASRNSGPWRTTTRSRDAIAPYSEFESTRLELRRDCVGRVTFATGTSCAAADTLYAIVC